MAIPAPRCTYQRRRPELTPCYRILQEHLSTFVAAREMEGRPLPDYVTAELEAYLKCGIPAHGFLRLVCEACQKEKIVAFSCKKRGFCPSCCAKRMAEAATHLTSHVLPLAPYRQFVVSFPVALRYWLHTNKRLAAETYAIVTKAIHRYYTDKATAHGIKDPTPGTISFLQRWGSALNLNPHLHIIALDGVYTRYGDLPRFRNLDPITDDEVAALVQAISTKVMEVCIRRGYLSKDGEHVAHPELDPLFQNHDALAMATASSIHGRIAFGPNAGRTVRRIGGGFGYGEEIPLAKGKRCYSVNGFSLHANTAVSTLARDQLYKLIEYIARGPLSNDRLEIQASGDVKLALKTPWASGVTHLLFTPEEFIERLVALIPPPRTHLVRWSGVFAPNSPYRKEITLHSEIKKGFQFEEKDATDDRSFRNYTWSKMLAKVFKIDVSKCDDCGGAMKKISAIIDPLQVRRYLQHVNIQYEPPARAPPRHQQGEFDFEAAQYQPDVDPLGT